MGRTNTIPNVLSVTCLTLTSRSNDQGGSSGCSWAWECLDPHRGKEGKCQEPKARRIGRGEGGGKGHSLPNLCLSWPQRQNGAVALIAVALIAVDTQTGCARCQSLYWLTV